MHKHTNHLAGESSPYLLQHAHNPVNWYPWGEEALALAKKENKPILVSIGYSSCHWCHVMERESFEDETTAEIMNEHFINIKIDREERPDLDHIYMDAVQAMTGSGGWPLNVFLTPDKKPFYGGTYFPPKKAFNRPSWQEVLLGVSNAFQQKRDEIDAQAENLIGHLQQANLFGKSTADQKDIFTKENIETAFVNVMKTADRQWGGFGSAPKFPQTFSIQFLLRHHHLAKNKEALELALLSLDKMINGGIYDQAGGGFARYSTDSEWLVPHFEKMLYDNALLVSVISEAFAITRNERYAAVIEETIRFLEREMMHTAGGFYTALDADSEGEEGKFYVWEYEEVKKILDADAEIFCAFFDITPGGNWEGKNILWRNKTEEDFCKEKNIPPGELKRIIISGKEKLMEKRSERIRPQLDDKIILGWNALMNAALSKAFAATGNPAYRQLAIKNMEFLLMAFKDDPAPRLFHTWKNKESKYAAFLDDYAYLIQALILLQEITGETKYLIKAKEFTGFVIDHFNDEQGVYFYFTARDQEDVIIRKKEIYDGAQPSGNSVMAENLFKLSLYFDLPEWGERASACIRGLEKAIINYPTSFGGWLGLLQQMVQGTHEIAIVGPAFQQKLDEVLPLYIPHKIVMCSENASSLFPLLADKKTGGSTLIYLCRHYACQKPVTNVAELMPFLA